METELQKYFQRLQSEVANNARHWLPASSKLTLESLISAVVVMFCFWIGAVLIQQIAQRFFQVRKIDEALSRFLLRVARFAILSLGFVTALGTLGVDVSAIVATLGLSTLALGIALKDVVSNAVSGVMLLIFRPFRHRDQIRVADFEGEVIDIDMRYTHLHTSDKVIFIPNSLLFANAVTVTKVASSQTGEHNPKQTIGMHSNHDPAVDSKLEAVKRRRTLLSLVADDADSAVA